MNKYKIQFHAHTKSDPHDWLTHSDFDLIDAAAKHNYDVLSITCHNKIVFSEELKKYAEEKGILLIPGIEKSIKKRHTLIINAQKDAEKIKNFNDLKKYKKIHPDCLIIAAHPYHPLPINVVSLGKYLDKNIDIFDAIEWSSFYTKRFKFNSKAVKNSKKYKLPLIGTGDIHMLEFINKTYTYVYAPNKNIKSIFSAIKKGKMEIHSTPFGFFRLAFMTLKLTFLELTRRVLKLFGLKK